MLSSGNQTLSEESIFFSANIAFPGAERVCLELCGKNGMAFQKTLPSARLFAKVSIINSKGFAAAVLGKLRFPAIGICTDCAKMKLVKISCKNPSTFRGIFAFILGCLRPGRKKALLPNGIQQTVFHLRRDPADTGFVAFRCRD